jgi:hypothetical protein
MHCKRAIVRAGGCIACPMHYKRAIVQAGGCMQSCGQTVALHVPCTHANREIVHAGGQLEDVHRAVWEGLFPL